MQISNEREYVSDYNTSLVIPYYNVVIEWTKPGAWKGLDKLPVPIEPKLTPIHGSEPSGSSSTYRLLDFKVKLSNEKVELPGFGGDRQTLARGVFIAPKRSGLHPMNGPYLNALNIKYNIYGGYFHSAYIKLGGLV